MIVPNFRGGVLEPEGTVEIKFRQRDLVKTMHRLDPKCLRLKEQLSAAGTEGSPGERTRLETELKKREAELMPMYHQVAVEFADLHDRAGRMQEKGVISVSSRNPKFYLSAFKITTLMQFASAVFFRPIRGHVTALSVTMRKQHFALLSL